MLCAKSPYCYKHLSILPTAKLLKSFLKFLLLNFQLKEPVFFVIFATKHYTFTITVFYLEKWSNALTDTCGDDIRTTCKHLSKRERLTELWSE